MPGNKQIVVHSSKQYPITSLSKDDLIKWFTIKYAKSSKAKKIMEAIDKMTDRDMRKLASLMEDDYIEHMFWSSMEYFFNEMFYR
jgi:hypothetical protein